MRANNVVILSGRLTKDPVIRTYEQGGEKKTWVTFGFAVSRRDKVDGVDYFDCKAFRKCAEIIASTCHKGTPIQILGQIRMRKYIDSAGNNRTAYDIEVEDFMFNEKKPTDSVSNTFNMPNVYEASEEFDDEPTIGIEVEQQYNESDLPF